jgi:oligopeptide/dipeptide ABC transporter ATP-binding protein
VKLEGRELVGLPPGELRKVRGKQISMVFQDPMMTLNPMLTIGTQIRLALEAHETVSGAEARRRAVAALAQVRIPDAEAKVDFYPHQFSGGMRQRVAIAIALLHRPKLIICDEPTTALDVSVQAEILAEMKELVAELGTALIWISHDLAVVSALADRIAVMYAGRIVEQGPAAQVIEAPLHPYTKGLIQSVPSRNKRGEPLNQILGMAPSILALPKGCAFRPRCPRADGVCLNTPPQEEHLPGRWVRCFHPHLAEAKAEVPA